MEEVFFYVLVMKENANVFGGKGPNKIDSSCAPAIDVKRGTSGYKNHTVKSR